MVLILLTSVNLVSATTKSQTNTDTITLTVTVNGLVADNTETLTLTVSINSANVNIGTNNNTLTLSVTENVNAGPFNGLENVSLELSEVWLGAHYFINWTITPRDNPYLTNINYTYECQLFAVNEAGSYTPSTGSTVAIYFDTSAYLTTKTTDGNGNFTYWAIVPLNGNHNWDFVIYVDGSWVSTVIKFIYFEQYGSPPSGPPSGGGGYLPPIPTNLDFWLNGLIAFLPALILIAVFMFFGHSLAGNIGAVGGFVAGIFVDCAVSFLPQFVLFFIILVGILFVMYKLKGGNSGGNGQA